MNLGTFAVGFPVFEIESAITFQTIRSPTVFERMVMRLCHRYKDEPAISAMSFQAVFEDVLGVAASIELVGSSAISSSGWRLNESAINTRCFIPPESSKG